MSARNESLLETSMFSSSQIHLERARRSTKRFRPATQCAHVNDETHEQCPADGFMECVHCDQICCLHHITQHQNELKRLRDQLVEEASDTYLTLSEMQVTDTREQLQTNLTVWKKRMFNKIERLHQQLLDDIEQSFVKVNSEFESKKKELLNDFDGSISTKLERLSTKYDFYPHELDDLKMSLTEMASRIRDARTSIINIDFGNGTPYLMDNDDSFEHDNNIHSPQIVIQTKPDIEQVLNGPYLRQFQINDDDNASNHVPLLYDTSNKHLLVCNYESRTLELFNHEERIGGGFWPNDSSPINCIRWCPYLNRFLVLCSQSLYGLNCSQQPFNIHSFSQIAPMDGIPMKYLTVSNDCMLIKHSTGVHIDRYSLKSMELLKRWSKSDFYCDEETCHDIHRLEFSSTFYLVMNVEINDESNVLDLFLFPTLQHIRRLDNCYLMLYLPLNNYWIVKQIDEHNQTDLCLLDQNGQLTRLNLSAHENIIGMRLFGKQVLLVTRQVENAIQMQLFHSDQF